MSYAAPSFVAHFLHAGTFGYYLVTDPTYDKTHDLYFVRLYQYRPGSTEPRVLTSAQQIRTLLEQCKRHGVHRCNASGPCVKSTRAMEEAERTGYRRTPQGPVCNACDTYIVRNSCGCDEGRDTPTHSIPETRTETTEREAENCPHSRNYDEDTACEYCGRKAPVAEPPTDDEIDAAINAAAAELNAQDARAQARVAQNLPHAQLCPDCKTFWDIRTGECDCGLPYQNDEDAA